MRKRIKRDLRESQRERLEREPERERSLVHPIRMALSDQRFRKRSPHEKYDENAHIHNDYCPYSHCKHLCILFSNSLRAVGAV